MYAAITQSVLALLDPSDDFDSNSLVEAPELLSSTLDVSLVICQTIEWLVECF